MVVVAIAAVVVVAIVAVVVVAVSSGMEPFQDRRRGLPTGQPVAAAAAGPGRRPEVGQDANHEEEAETQREDPPHHVDQGDAGPGLLHGRSVLACCCVCPRRRMD